MIAQCFERPSDVGVFRRRDDFRWGKSIQSAGLPRNSRSPRLEASRPAPVRVLRHAHRNCTGGGLRRSPRGAITKYVYLRCLKRPLGTASVHIGAVRTRSAPAPSLSHGFCPLTTEALIASTRSQRWYTGLATKPGALRTAATRGQYSQSIRELDQPRALLQSAAALLTETP